MKEYVRVENSTRCIHYILRQITNVRKS